MSGQPEDLELQSVIGEGGGGVVYAGRLGGAAVAVKVLRAELALSDRERARFFDEAERMRRVEHPGLVPLIEAGTLDDGRPFLAMPMLAGETLAARIARGPLPVADAVRVVAELGAAVDALHAAGLVHRDLKPENVMLVDAGLRPVILDFGIAREASAAPSTTTQAGSTRGTPAYMAPERFFGAPASAATDVYELAVTAYAMLAGQLPWADAQDPSVRIQPAPLAGPHVPRAICDVVMTALSTRPEARPASAGAFAAALAAAEASAASGGAELSRRTSGIAAPPLGVATARTGAATPARARLLAVGASALVVAAIAVGLTFGLSLGEAPRRNAKPPVVQTQAQPLPKTPTPAPEFTTPTASTPCGRLLELYCSDAWRRTEGAMAGALCRANGHLARAAGPMQPGCQRTYEQTLAVLRERRDSLARDAGPPR